MIILKYIVMFLTCGIVASTGTIMLDYLNGTLKDRMDLIADISIGFGISFVLTVIIACTHLTVYVFVEL